VVGNSAHGAATRAPNREPQAQFKRECKTDSLCIGQELQNDVALPVWMRQVLLNTAAKAFSSTTRVEVEGTPR
jgi:hypothetical protein